LFITDNYPLSTEILWITFREFDHYFSWGNDELCCPTEIQAVDKGSRDEELSRKGDEAALTALRDDELS
jgi:hypothetical protein